MSVVYHSPASRNNGNVPSTHVLIIGIGDYPHLAQGSDPPTYALARLEQLDSPPRAALSIARWFIGDGRTSGFNDPEAPLATVELLASPPTAFVSPDWSDIPVDRPTSDRITRAFQDWLSRLQTNERNVGVFYFCGNGVHVHTQGDVLLASDFGKNSENPWSDAFNISETITAMRSAVAGPLYFFVDSFRENVPRTETVLTRTLVQLKAPQRASEGHLLVLQGVNPGTLAFAPDGALPFFTDALIKALCGAAYVGKGASDPGIVTSRSLVETVPVLMRQLLPAEAKTQSPHSLVQGQDRAFHVKRDNQAKQPPSSSPATSPSEGESSRTADSLRQTFRVGASYDFARTASDDEVCLQVDDYADVIADLFAQTRDELCFAIFGAWGRGKTFLAERVAKALKKKAPNCLTVRFSAWRFPTAPEVWVHLYETFADAAFNGSPLRRIPNIVRTGMAKNGHRGLLLSYAAVAIGAVPIYWLLESVSILLLQAYLVLGVYGMIFVWTLFNGVRKTQSRLAREYLTPNRHTEKLGLQATIGKDLRHLLDGWMPANGFPWSFLLGYWLITACLAGAAILRFDGDASWTGLLYGIVRLDIQAGGGPIPTAIAIALIVLSAALALTWLRFGGDQPSRVLLVVDDLDRCHPDHLISVVESIKLLVEDPAISSRVQVLMLVEEEVLRHAILEKYGRLIQDRKDGLVSSYDAPRLVRETCEKLFTAQLRLPQLSTQEVRDLVETFSGFRKALSSELKELEERERWLRWDRDARVSESVLVKPAKPGKRLPSTVAMRTGLGDVWLEEPEPAEYRRATQEELTAMRKEVDEARDRSKAELQRNENRAQELQDYLKPPSLPRGATPAAVTGTTLTEDEVKAILKALFAEGIELRDHLGPRTVRAFLFRYQLARLLLIKLGLPWTPSDLAYGLASEFIIAAETKRPLPPSGNSSDVVNLARVIDQVS